MFPKVTESICSQGNLGQTTWVMMFILDNHCFFSQVAGSFINTQGWPMPHLHQPSPDSDFKPLSPPSRLSAVQRCSVSVLSTATCTYQALEMGLVQLESWRKSDVFISRA